MSMLMTECDFDSAAPGLCAECASVMLLDDPVGVDHYRALLEAGLDEASGARRTRMARDDDDEDMDLDDDEDDDDFDELDDEDDLDDADDFDDDDDDEEFEDDE